MTITAAPEATQEPVTGSQPHATDTRTFGALTFVATRTVDGGYALNVFRQAERLAPLCFTTRDRAAFRARYRQTAEAALASQHPDDIATTLHGPAEAVLAAVAELVNAAPTPTFDTVVGDTYRPQVAPTLAGAHLADLTEAQSAALEQAVRAGRVYRGGNVGQAPVTVLRALARKGLLTLTARPGSRRADWAYGEPTDAGRARLAKTLAGTR